MRKVIGCAILALLPACTGDDPMTTLRTTVWTTWSRGRSCRGPISESPNTLTFPSAIFGDGACGSGGFELHVCDGDVDEHRDDLAEDQQRQRRRGVLGDLGRDLQRHRARQDDQGGPVVHAAVRVQADRGQIQVRRDGHRHLLERRPSASASRVNPWRD